MVSSEKAYEEYKTLYNEIREKEKELYFARKKIFSTIGSEVSDFAELRKRVLSLDLILPSEIDLEEAIYSFMKKLAAEDKVICAENGYGNNEYKIINPKFIAKSAIRIQREKFVIKNISDESIQITFFKSNSSSYGDLKIFDDFDAAKLFIEMHDTYM